MSDLNSTPCRRGRILYIIEAALEYLVSILVAGSYLATLTNELGFSDSLTGILSSFISLGCLFQLLSLLVRPRRVKSLVVSLSIANQLLFLLLYVIPVVHLSPRVKTVLFAAFIFGAYFLYNLAHPKKINWLMSLVDDHHRGTFTAWKEILSLITGMAFSFGMGSLIDHFKAKNDLRTALLLSAAVLFVLMLLHTLSMLFTVEIDHGETRQTSLKKGLEHLLHNRSLRHITIVFVLYYIGHYVAIPFYGSYLIKELGCSLTFVSGVTILGSVSRILVSHLWGRYADKNSFAAMIEKCLLMMALSYVFMVFANPQTGKYMYVLYTVFHGIAMGGINSALTNLVFDYVPYEERSDSLAVCQASAGTVGFLTTLCISPLITYVQQRGCIVCGTAVYAQQIVTVIGFVFLCVTALYVRAVILPKQKA